MPKMKSSSTAKKRFRVTGSGRLMRRRGTHNHLNYKKSESRKRRLTHDTEVHKGSRKTVRKLVPYL